MDHTHGPSGEVIWTEPAAATPEGAEAEAVEAAADASVEIAKIEADRDVAIEKERTKQQADWTDQEKAELYGRLKGMEETLARVMPQPEPEPEPVPVPEPEPEEDILPAPEPDVPADEPPTEAKRAGYWDAYR
jgi:hypothetical protein